MFGGLRWGALIPTSEALCLRGISVPSPSCSFCRSDLEGADHILVSSSLARTVWDWVQKWCVGDPIIHSKVGEILEYAKRWGRCSKRRSMFTVICYGVFWTLWKTRNVRVFQNRLASSSMIIDEILSLVFLWFKHRGKLGNCNWSLWCMSPFNCL